MNTKTLLSIGVVGVLAYYLLRKKKMVEVSDLKKQPVNVIPPIVVQPKNQVTLSDLSSKLPPNSIANKITIRNSRVILDNFRTERKAPIVINPINLIPSVYNREIGREINLAASGEITGFETLGGTCTDQIANACNCTKDKINYKIDIPKLF